MTVALFPVVELYAQTIKGIPYQTVVRDEQGNPVADQELTVRFYIQRELPSHSDAQPLLYSETHTATSDANGLVRLQVGEGTPVEGSFDAVDWWGKVSIKTVATGPLVAKSTSLSMWDMTPTTSTSRLTAPTSIATTSPTATLTALPSRTPRIGMSIPLSGTPIGCFGSSTGSCKPPFCVEEPIPIPTGLIPKISICCSISPLAEVGAVVKEST